MAGKRFPADHGIRLSNEERRRIQPADEIVQRMAPLPWEIAADLGCGTGYVTIPLASRVAKVFAVDVQQAMLDHLLENVPPNLTDRIVPLRGELPRLPLDDRSIDRAVMVNVVHEVDDLSVLDSEVGRCLRVGGRLSIVDFPPRETSFGPPLHERLSADTVMEALPSFCKLREWSFPDFYQLELSLGVPKRPESPP